MHPESRSLANCHEQKEVTKNKKVYEKRKLTIAILMMLATASTMNAQSVNPNGNAEQIPLTWTERPPINTGTPFPKAPMLIPSVYLNGYTINVDNRLTGYTLELYQDDELTYQHFILDGECSIELPSILSGNYVIRFVNAEGNAYVGVITL